MRCPSCSNKILQKSGTSTRLRVQGAVEFGADGVCTAQCYWCKAKVSIPNVALRKAADDEEIFMLTTPGKPPA